MRDITELQREMAAIKLQIKALSTRLGMTYSTEFERAKLQQYYNKLKGQIEHRPDGLKLVPKHDSPPPADANKAVFKAVELSIVKPLQKPDIWGDGR